MTFKYMYIMGKKIIDFDFIEVFYNYNAYAITYHHIGL